MTSMPSTAWWSRRAVATAVACTLLLCVLAPIASTFPYDVYRDGRLVVLASWKDPASGGEDLRFRISPDGSRLLLLGFGAPDEVRVTDLDTGNATVLEMPEPGFAATGCDWSQTGAQVVVWGSVDGTPRILVYDAPSFGLNATVPWTGLVDLADVTEVTFLSYDIIIGVAGRDANGISRLMFIETEQLALRWNYAWEGNATILTIDDQGGDIVILDTSETLTLLGGHDWTGFMRYGGALRGGPASWSIPWGFTWILGDSTGRVVTPRDPAVGSRFNITVGDGPVQGVCWTPFRYSNFVVATGLPGGGSRLAAWQIWAEPPFGEMPREQCSLELDTGVTMMATDPRSQARVLVATDDGSLLCILNDNRPFPSEVHAGEPDQVDGRGLEPLVSWNPGGRSFNPRFYFNHRGSLIALHGFGANGDLRVVDRTFETVAELDVPWEPSGFGGLEWSHGDRWLVVWGYVNGPGAPPVVLKVYDAPTFKPSKTFPRERVLELVTGIQSMEFLPGDEVLAMACVDEENLPRLMFLDLRTGEVLGRTPIPDEGMPDLRSDGDDLVGLRNTSGLWVTDPVTMEFTRENVGPDFYIADWDVNATSGWCFVESQYNVSLWNGTPRQEALRWDVWPYDPVGLVWANGQAGDLVLGCLRPASGTSLQLWRRGPVEEANWRYRDGYTMVSELNTSRDLVQLEADPAYPGVVAASFLDGTISLYNLNVTPYPPPPEELGDIDTGPIYPLEDGDGTGGDGTDRPWGSEHDWVFPVVLVAAVALLAIALLVLRPREREQEPEQEPERGREQETERGVEPNPGSEREPERELGGGKAGMRGRED